MENLELTIGTTKTSLEAYTELLFRLLYQAPAESDVLFVHANQDHEVMERLVARAADLYCSGYASWIVMNGLTLEEANAKNVSYEGFTFWQDYLTKEREIPEEKVVATKPAKNTPEETAAFLELVDEYGWRKPMLFAAPGQLMRAYLQMVAFLNDQERDLRIVFQTTHAPLDWEKTIKKNLLGGGMLEGTRAHHVCEEVKRLALYIRGCDPKFAHHATIEEGLAYFNKIG